MTLAEPDRWSDLAPRIWSALVLAVVCGVALWAGGRVFHVAVGLLVGVMIWELAQMRGRSSAIGWASAAAAAVILVPELPAALLVKSWAIALLFAAAAIGLVAATGRWLGAVSALMIAGGGLSILIVRDLMGANWVLGLVLVVVATDVAGYVAGRALGGPKFWPAVSPKKTWSGVLAGWLASALVGLLAALSVGGAGASLVVTAVALSFAAQLGDLAESVIKRRSGVKDSSQLIPGHGGVMDRFDGFIGASLAAGALALASGLLQDAL